MKQLFFYFLAGTLMASDFTEGQREWQGSDYNEFARLQREVCFEVVDATAFKKGETILDLGCGDGLITKRIQGRAKDATLIGYDLSPSQIRFAQERYADDNLSFKVLAGEDLNDCDRYDTVFCFNAFHWMTDPRKALSNIYASLKEGGRLISIVPLTDFDLVDGAFFRVMTKPKWEKYFKQEALEYAQDRERTLTFEEMCRDIGFIDVKAVVKRRSFTFFDREELKNWLRAITVGQQLEREAREVLLQEVADEIAGEQTGEITIHYTMLYLNASK